MSIRLSVISLSVTVRYHVKNDSSYDHAIFGSSLKDSSTTLIFTWL